MVYFSLTCCLLLYHRSFFLSRPGFSVVLRLLHNSTLLLFSLFHLGNAIIGSNTLVQPLPQGIQLGSGWDFFPSLLQVKWHLECVCKRKMKRSEMPNFIRKLIGGTCENIDCGTGTEENCFYNVFIVPLTHYWLHE